MGQRITGMTSGQKTLPVAHSIFKFAQHGKSGAWVSELLPHHREDRGRHLTIIRTMHTDAINHDPAITFIQTGSQQPGRPSMGSWVSYGLGSENENLPAFVVMISQASGLECGSAAVLAAVGQRISAVELSGREVPRRCDPVLYLSNPPGIDREPAARMLDALAEAEPAASTNEYRRPGDRDANRAVRDGVPDADVVPELMDLSKEPRARSGSVRPGRAQAGHVCAATVCWPGGMAERGVRFIQLYHRGWDQHNDLPQRSRVQCEGHRSAFSARWSRI